MEWAEQNRLSWPPHFLDNLLSFQKFLDGIATAGPFRSLLHLALVFSKSEGISVRQLLPKVQENVVINLVEEEEANESGAECQFILDRQGDLSDTDSTERLTSAVERFNLFIDSLTVGLKAAVGSPEGPPSRGLPWNLLRQFEKNLLRDLRCSEKTLLTLLADACDPDKDVARPVYLFPKSFVSGNAASTDGAAAQTASAIQEEAPANSAQDAAAKESNKMDTVNVQAVRNFVLRLTCLLERSLEAIVDLVARELKTTESADLLNVVQCFLAESVVGSLEPPRLSYLFHTLFEYISLLHPQGNFFLSPPPAYSPLDFAFLGPKQAGAEAVTCGMLQSKFAQELVSQRSAVLGLLATCPPMLDPEQWTLWSYPGFLGQRWGELEEFMQNCSALEVCDKFNLIILKLSSGGYLRLSATVTSKALEEVFLSWQQQHQRTTKSPSPLRGLCDALVGSALSINRLSVEDAVTTLASRLRNLTDCQLWIQLVLDILLVVPLSLLGLLFAKVLLPALDEAGLRDKNAWASDRRDLQSPASPSGGSVGLLDLLLSGLPEGGGRHCRRQQLITAVGALGSQLGWSAWVNFYHRHRYVSTAAPADVPLPKSLEPTVVRTAITLVAEETPASPEEKSPHKETTVPLDRPSREEGTSSCQGGHHLKPPRFCGKPTTQGRPCTSTEEDQQQLGSILVPEWIDPVFSRTPLPLPRLPRRWHKPMPVLPGTEWRLEDRLQAAPLEQSPRFHGCRRFRTCQGTHLPPRDALLRRLKNIHFRLHRVRPLGQAGGESSSYLELVTIEETSLSPVNSEAPLIPTKTNEHQWLVFTRHFWVEPDQLRRLGCHTKVALKHTNISVGINLSDTSPPTEYPVYAFLPVRSAGFAFLLNADFDLTSSREDVDGSSVWNRWLVGQLPTVFENLLLAIVEASPHQLKTITVSGLSQQVLLRRILNCLPLGGASRKSATAGVAAARGTPSSIFSCVGEQLRDRLSRVAWIPVKPADGGGGAGFAAPRQVLCLPNSLLQSGRTASQATSSSGLVRNTVTPATSSDNFLIRLLIERLGMLELDSTFLTEPPSDGHMAATDVTSAESESVSRMESCLEKLLAMGVQTVSAESLLELSSNLSPDELKRPGVLLALIGNIENSFRSYGDLNQSLLQVAVSNHSNRRRRCSLALRHLAIFPLTDGRLVSLAEVEAAAAAAESSVSLMSQNRVLLPPPPPSPSSGSSDYSSGDIEEVYGAYVSLLSRLGPLVSPSSIYPSMGHEAAVLPQLFTEPTNRDGLGLSIASPEVVLRQWVAPRLASVAAAAPTTTSRDKTDWFVAAAQFVVWCSTQLHASQPSPLFLSATTREDFAASALNDLTCLLQELPAQLPLLVSNRVQLELAAVAADTDATSTRLLPPLSSLPEGVRSTPLFVQPFLLSPHSYQVQVSTEEGSMDTEADLMRLCLSGEFAIEATLVSSSYFFAGRTSLETLGLLSTACLAYWLEFFLQAGASTLQSLHRRQYRYGDLPVHLPALPSDHVLMAPLVKVLGSILERGASWIVEDTVCPGLDVLLLPWIERTAEAGPRPLVMTACSKLANLLNSGWSNFERSKLALYHRHTDQNPLPGLRSTVQGRSRSYEFAAASWLVNLRVCEWLPVAQSRDVTAVRRRLQTLRAPEAEPLPPPASDLHLASSAQYDLAAAAEPNLTSHIYSPNAFAPAGGGFLETRSPELTALLRILCPVWQPSVVEGTAALPTCLNFTEALGLRTRLDEASLEYLMDFLASSCEGLFAPSFMTPSLLLRVYELVQKFATDRLTVPHGGHDVAAASRGKDWLRDLLAPPSSRTILVPCLLSAKFSGKRRRGSEASAPERCLACLRLQAHCLTEPRGGAVGEGPRKRRHSSGRDDVEVEEAAAADESSLRHHLVPASWTCWQQANLPELTLPSGTELTQEEVDDDDAGDEEDTDFELSSPTPAVVMHAEGEGNDPGSLPPLDISDERIPLCDSYGSEWKTFFCDTLKVPVTSSVAEVLRLRPTAPSGTANDGNYRRAQKHFGRRLGAWYALLQFCIASENLTSAQIEDCLFNFPLLYDLSGRWRTPNSGRLFAWSAPDLAALFIRAAPTGSSDLLGHNLPTLEASVNSPVNVRIGSAPGFRESGTLVGTANALLLDVLHVPLLDQVASLSVGLFEVPSQAGMIAGFAIPCSPLDAVLKAFRKLAQAWLSAPTRATSLTPSSFINTVPSHRIEAYFVPDLTVTLSINMPGELEGHSGKWIIPNIACRLVNEKLYMDSRFGEYVFADFTAAAAATASEGRDGSTPAAMSPLARLHSALTRTAASAANETTEGGIRVESIQQLLLAELARALLPTSPSSQLALIHFVRGFLNVTAPLLEEPLHPEGRRQLHAYMLSHGIARSQANNLLNSLLPPAAPQPSESSSSSSVQRPPPSVDLSASLPEAARPTSVASAGATATPVSSVMEPANQRNLPASRPLRLSQLTAVSRGTRFQTLLSEAFSSGTSNSQSRSTEKDGAASSEAFWRGITDASDSSALSTFTRERLSRALASGGSQSSTAEIGRMGEMAVFQYLEQAIHRGHRDAQLAFPTGHPNLGSGRLVDCHWVNADSESRLPYDITITLEVECPRDRWHAVLNSLSQEVAQRYVTVSRTPSRQEATPGLLTVGPVYLEVKSTAALDDQSSRLDIFEFSLSEAVFAYDKAWRYHLVRVHWARRPEASAPAPVLTHVPNLSETLFTASGLRMCLAMAVPQQATATSD
ncbi:hypothetical protein AAHC03_05681 [Spirometra sp. Aus1]